MLPDTSFCAHETFEKMGHGRSHRNTILRCIQYRPGLTAPDIALLVGLTQVQVSRRVLELVRAGLVMEVRKPGDRFTRYDVPKRKGQGNLF